MRPQFISFIVLTCISASSIGCTSLSAHAGEETEHESTHPIVTTNPVRKDVDTTQHFVCQIHASRHVELRALERGYLQQIKVQEGQAVKKGQTLFKLLPVVYKARLHADEAELERADISLRNTELLSKKNIVSDQELAMAKAERGRAKARVELAMAELGFTDITAPFDGIVDRQYEQQGSLLEEGDMLTTVSDNSLMWVYFNVPEARYLEYKTRLDKEKDELKIELQLANGELFPYPGQIGAIEADFNNETGNIAFRADFPNPEGLLRHGQTGTILIHRKVPNAIVIPQRATYEILAKKYVYVVEPTEKSSAKQDYHKPAKSNHAPAAEDQDERSKQRGIVRQREIAIQEEMDDIYVIKDGVDVNDKIIFEGIRQVRDGEEVEFVLKPPTEILSNLKYHAE